MLIRRVRDGSNYLYQVGSIQYFRVDGPAFECVYEFSTLEKAAAFLNFLNGGDGKFIEPLKDRET